MKRLFVKMVIAAGVMVSGNFIYGAQNVLLEMPIVQQWTGFNSNQEKPRRLVIRDQKSWAETWAAMRGNVEPKPAVPAVDFEKHVVVAVFMGRKSSGGYAVKIVSIKKGKDKVRVTVKESNPPEGAMVTMALTSPYHVVVVPKSDKDVEFVDQKNLGQK